MAHGTGTPHDWSPHKQHVAALQLEGTTFQLIPAEEDGRGEEDDEMGAEAEGETEEEEVAGEAPIGEGTNASSVAA